MTADEADLELAVAAATEAADHALWRSTRGFRTWDKGDRNPVTSSDLEVDQLLKDRLLGGRPGYGWLSEETADSPLRLGQRQLWVVDPIDGTRDYVRGRDGWAVSVALVVDGTVRIGVLAAPALGRIFVGTAAGATMNGHPITISGRTDEVGMRLPIDPAFAAARLWDEPWQVEPIAKPNSIALRMALVACGEADGLIDGRLTNEWDVAAASRIVEAAGGRVTDREGQAFRFNKPEPDCRGIVAATPALHERLAWRLATGRAALAKAGVTLERDG